MPTDELNKRIQKYETRMMAFAEDLIRIPSENPPGNFYRECSGRIERELEALAGACLPIVSSSHLEA